MTIAQLEVREQLDLGLGVLLGVVVAEVAADVTGSGHSKTTGSMGSIMMSM
jgi:hypothetical protein